MIALDASVLIAHLDPLHVRQEEATRLLRESAREGFVIHSLNLAEVLVGGARQGRGEEMLRDVEAIGVRVAERPTGEPLRLASLRATTGLRLPDCCALDAALSTGSVLATFDARVAEAARRCHVAVVP